MSVGRLKVAWKGLIDIDLSSTTPSILYCDSMQSQSPWSTLAPICDLDVWVTCAGREFG